MANPEHMEILKQGVEVWNKWRANHLDVRPELSGLDFSRANLVDVDLKGARLSRANLTGANLERANLAGANLSVACLIDANLIDANLSGVLLHDADIRDADLSEGNLNKADLSRADIRGADLSDTDLSGANLRQADLRRAHLSGACLTGTNFTRVVLASTSFANNDLSQAVDLEYVDHRGPSYLSIDTIYKSHGNVSEVFLRGCGVPGDFITYMRSLTVQPIQFHSCFISYSSKDQELAERLHADLQNKGVRVWFAPHDLPIGARIRPAIDESIRVHDKLLLVLSEASVSSQWVEQEVETALAREREQEGKTVLFPIRLDDAVMESKAGWPALLKNTRNVGDFTRWKDFDFYQSAFGRLLRDLKAGT